MPSEGSARGSAMASPPRDDILAPDGDGPLLDASVGAGPDPVDADALGEVPGMAPASGAAFEDDDALLGGKLPRDDDARASLVMDVPRPADNAWGVDFEGDC